MRRPLMQNQHNWNYITVGMLMALSPLEKLHSKKQMPPNQGSSDSRPFTIAL
jgi:hypothetical protein